MIFTKCLTWARSCLHPCFRLICALCLSVAVVLKMMFRCCPNAVINRVGKNTTIKQLQVDAALQFFIQIHVLKCLNSMFVRQAFNDFNRFSPVLIDG